MLLYVPMIVVFDLERTSGESAENGGEVVKIWCSNLSKRERKAAWGSDSPESSTGGGGDEGIGDPGIFLSFAITNDTGLGISPGFVGGTNGSSFMSSSSSISEGGGGRREMEAARSFALILSLTVPDLRRGLGDSGASLFEPEIDAFLGECV